MSLFTDRSEEFGRDSFLYSIYYDPLVRNLDFELSVRRTIKKFTVRLSLKRETSKEPRNIDSYSESVYSPSGSDPKPYFSSDSPGLDRWPLRSHKSRWTLNLVLPWTLRSPPKIILLSEMYQLYQSNGRDERNWLSVFRIEKGYGNFVTCKYFFSEEERDDHFVRP